MTAPLVKPEVKLFCAASIWWWEVVVAKRLLVRSDKGFLTRAGARRNFDAAARAFKVLSR